MRPSAEYVLVRDGKVITEPKALPINYGSHTNLHSKSDEELAKLGWYPVEYRCAKCTRKIEYIFDEKAQRVVAKPTYENLATAKAHRKNQLWASSVQTLVVNGVESNALGSTHLYGFDFSLCITLISAILSEIPVPIPCVRKETNEFRSVMHSPQELRKLLSDYTRFAAQTYADAGMTLEDIENAADIEETAMVAFPSSLVRFASPFEPVEDGRA